MGPPIQAARFSKMGTFCENGPPGRGGMPSCEPRTCGTHHFDTLRKDSHGFGADPRGDSARRQLKLGNAAPKRRSEADGRPTSVGPAEAKARFVQNPRSHRAVGDLKRRGIPVLPTPIPSRAILPRIALDGGYGRDTGGQGCGVQERGPGAGQVLNTEEQAKLLAAAPIKRASA